MDMGHWCRIAIGFVISMLVGHLALWLIMDKVALDVL